MPVDGSVYEEYISVPDAADKEYSEPFKVVPGSKAIKYLDIAIIA
jgi:hypothetical protein